MARAPEWRPLAWVLRYVAEKIEGAVPAAQSTLRIALERGDIKTRAAEITGIPVPFDPREGLPEMIWADVREGSTIIRSQIKWDHNMVRGTVHGIIKDVKANVPGRVIDVRGRIIASGVQLYWPDVLACWPAEEEEEPQPRHRRPPGPPPNMTGNRRCVTS